MSVLTASAPTAPHIIKIRPRRGARFSNFYPQPPAGGPSLSAIDSAFQIQEYIAQVIRKDPHNVEAIVTIPEKSRSSASAGEDGKDETGGESSNSAEEQGAKTEYAVDESCWIYEHLRRLAQDLTYPLIVLLQQECNRSTCPEMKAGEWLYLCVAHGSDGSMEQCCAIDYILHTLDSATALLNSPRAFPSRLQIPAASTKHFPSLARRLGRIFAHAYCHHREAFETAEAENSLYARFLALSTKFNLVPSEFLTVPGQNPMAGPSLGPAAPPPLSPLTSSSSIEKDIKDEARNDDQEKAKAGTGEQNDAGRKGFSYPPPGTVSGFGPSSSSGISPFTRTLDPETAELGRSASVKNASPSGKKIGRSRTDTMVHSDAYAQAYLNSGYWGGDNGGGGGGSSDEGEITKPMEDEGEIMKPMVDELDNIESSESQLGGFGSRTISLPSQQARRLPVEDTHDEDEKTQAHDEEDANDDAINPHAEVDIVDDSSIVIGFGNAPSQQHVEDETESSHIEPPESTLIEEERDLGDSVHSSDDAEREQIGGPEVDHTDEKDKQTELETDLEDASSNPIAAPVHVDETPLERNNEGEDSINSSAGSGGGSGEDTVKFATTSVAESTPQAIPATSQNTEQTQNQPDSTGDAVSDFIVQNMTGIDKDTKQEWSGLPNVSDLVQLSSLRTEQCHVDDPSIPYMPSLASGSGNLAGANASSMETASVANELPNIHALKVLSTREEEYCKVVVHDVGGRGVGSDEYSLPDLRNLTLLAAKPTEMCSPAHSETIGEDNTTLDSESDNGGFVVLDSSDGSKGN